LQQLCDLEKLVKTVSGQNMGSGVNAQRRVVEADRSGFAECSKEPKGEDASAGVATGRGDPAMMCPAQPQPQPQPQQLRVQQPGAQPQQEGPYQQHFQHEDHDQQPLHQEDSLLQHFHQDGHVRQHVPLEDQQRDDQQQDDQQQQQQRQCKFEIQMPASNVTSADPFSPLMHLTVPGLTEVTLGRESCVTLGRLVSTTLGRTQAQTLL